MNGYHNGHSFSSASNGKQEYKAVGPIPIRHVIRYSREQILHLKNSPLSKMKIELSTDLSSQLEASRRRLSYSTPPFQPKETNFFQPQVPPHPPTIKHQQQQQVPLTLSQHSQQGSGMTPVLVYRQSISQEPTYIQVQRQLNSLTLDLPNAISPRPLNHFHRRRTTPWNIPLPPPPLPHWPAPYIKNYAPDTYDQIFYYS